MTTKADRYLQEEKDMVEERVAIHEGRLTRGHGNPITREDGEAWISQTVKYIQQNEELYAD